jgi:hypothetical protein
MPTPTEQAIAASPPACWQPRRRQCSFRHDVSTDCSPCQPTERGHLHLADKQWGTLAHIRQIAPPQSVVGKMLGSTAKTAVQVGYTVVDIVAKAVFGVFIYVIAFHKSEAEQGSHGIALARMATGD